LSWLVYSLPLITFLSLSLPKLGQGEFNVDTGWYAAIAHQAWHNAGKGDMGALWTLMGVGGAAEDGGIAYFNKPPLGFWLSGLPLGMLGPTLLAARVGSVIAAALTVVALVAIVKQTCGQRTALAAGMVLATTLEFTRHTHSFSLDLWHGLFVFLSAAPFALAAARETKGEHRARWGRAAVVGGVGLGLALLTKPLQALIAPLFVLAWLVGSGRARWSKWVVASVGIGIAVALPWHGGMVWEHGREFTSQYFGREIAARAAGKFGEKSAEHGSSTSSTADASLSPPTPTAPPNSPPSGSNVPAGTQSDPNAIPAAMGGDAALVSNEGARDPFYYVKEIGKSGWPWTATVLLAMVAAARGERLTRYATIRKKSGGGAGDVGGLGDGGGVGRARLGVAGLAILFVVGWLVLLSIFPDKRPRYLVLLYPWGAWLSGQWLCSAAPGVIRRNVRRGAVIVCLLAAAAGAVISVAPVTLHKPESAQWTELFAFLRERGAEHSKGVGAAGVDGESGAPANVWQGGFIGPRGARLYLEFGRWPVPTADGLGRRIASPPPGALIAYHARDGLAPGPSETVVFESGDLTVTELREGVWSPVARARRAAGE